MPSTTEPAPGVIKDASNPCRDRREVPLPDGQIVWIRSVELTDDAPLQTFFSQISPNDLRLRFFSKVSPWDPSLSADLAQIRKKGAVAWLALDDRAHDIWGIGQLHPEPTGSTAEFAVLIRSDMKGRGIGWVLLNHILDCASTMGIDVVAGQVLQENTTMLAMCREFGFTAEPLDVASHVEAVRIHTKPSENKLPTHR